jgi:hypothetical protein
MATTFAGICLGVIVWGSDRENRHHLSLPPTAIPSLAAAPGSEGAGTEGQDPRLLMPDKGYLQGLPDEAPRTHVPSHVVLMGTMAALIDVIFSIAMFFFAAVHWWMAARLQTTIEGPQTSRPFNLGIRRNIEVHFGRDPRLWLLPVWGDGPSGDGVHWQLVDGSWDGISEETPVKDDFDGGLDDDVIVSVRPDTAIRSADGQELEAVELISKAASPNAARSRKVV